MTEIFQHKAVNSALAPSDILEQRASWILLCLVVLFAVWISGASLLLSLCVAGIASLPAFIQILASRFGEDASHELEMAAWIVIVMVGATAMGGAVSPISAAFFIPVVTALSLGRKRQAIEASAFSVLSFCLAALLSRMEFLPIDVETFQPAPGLFALISLIYMASLARKIQLGENPSAILSRFREKTNGQIARLSKQKDILVERLKKSDSAYAKANEQHVIAASKISELETKLEQRTLYFAKTSHELRTPLNAILGFSEIMKEGVFGELPEKYKEYAQLIHEGGRSLQLTVDDVLDLSKIDSGQYVIQPEMVSLTELMWETVRFMADQARRGDVKLSISSRTKDVEAYADPRAVRQIAQNLVSNAIKFTPHGGSIAISVREAEEGGAWMSVRDTGPGMSKDTFEAVLAPFSQADTAAKSKYTGTGLGLSVVNAFVNLHKGRLQLDSEPDEGSVISAYFPPKVEQ
ncbi:sensor histidine kinase [Hirschia litorea]|uniref:histidine kinase n=1 Tax=Hirschia litorea TaxID=1199156 RepID=A0ABW2IJ67_9PROT